MEQFKRKYTPAMKQKRIFVTDFLYDSSLTANNRRAVLPLCPP